MPVLARVGVAMALSLSYAAGLSASATVSNGVESAGDMGGVVPTYSPVTSATRWGGGAAGGGDADPYGVGVAVLVPLAHATAVKCGTGVLLCPTPGASAVVDVGEVLSTTASPRRRDGAWYEHQSRHFVSLPFSSSSPRPRGGGGGTGGGAVGCTECHSTTSLQ